MHSRGAAPTSIFPTIYHITPRTTIPTNRSHQNLSVLLPLARSADNERARITAFSLPLVLASSCFRHRVGLERS